MHRILTKIGCVISFFMALATSAAAQGACASYTAPGQFENPAGEWNGWDSGIVVDGFVGLRSSSSVEKQYRVLHGIDVSSGDELHYDKLKDCGTAFSFIRVDKKIMSHWNSFTRVGIVPIPYVFFPIEKSLRAAKLYNFSPEDQVESRRFLDRFGAIGREAASRYAAKIDGLFPNGIPEVSLANFEGQIIALDIEEKLIESNVTQNQAINYGRSYAHATCEWIRSTQQRYPNLLVTLYTTPSVYQEYFRYALPDDDACLQAAVIWAARTTRDGSDIIGRSKSEMDRAAQRMCLVTGGNRCVIHQYTHRAVFGVKGPSIGGHPPHMDANRFFTIKAQDNALGRMYIRTEELE